MQQHHVARAKMLHAVAQHLNICLRRQLTVLLKATGGFCILRTVDIGHYTCAAMSQYKFGHSSLPIVA